jgi:hypothetical protein
VVLALVPWCVLFKVLFVKVLLEYKAIARNECLIFWFAGDSDPYSVFSVFRYFDQFATGEALRLTFSATGFPVGPE